MRTCRYWNRYPGAQCDIESYVYMPLLEELNSIPTEKYARANELLKHAEAIGRRWGLYDKALFQTETHSMHWDEKNALWTTKTSRNDTIRSRFVIPAAGPLHRPKLPGLKGIESFQGHSFHSSRWDYNYTGGDSTGNLRNLADKRVGIIGTGATAVQIVPHLGRWAKEVYVFQRTPSSIDVRGNRDTDSEWAASLKPGWQKERMDNFNIIVNGGITEVDLVKDGWTDILHKLLARAAPTKNGEPVDPAKAAAERQIADYEKMEQVRARCDTVIKDPATAQSLKPWYNQLCKRPCFHDEYLQAFNLPNVHLIDTEGRGVDGITETGVIANNHLHELDVLIYATGFELSTEYSHRSNMEIYGRGGRTITEAWKDGTRTLHGWTTRDFPNCFWVQSKFSYTSRPVPVVLGCCLKKAAPSVLSLLSSSRCPEKCSDVCVVVQAALSPNFLHVTGEQAAHLAYVVSECRRRAIKTVEPTAQAEGEWVETIIRMAKLRVEFLRECTVSSFILQDLYWAEQGCSQKQAAAGLPGFGVPFWFLSSGCPETCPDICVAGVLQQ